MSAKVIAILGPTESGKTFLIEKLLSLTQQKIKNIQRGPTLHLTTYGTVFNSQKLYLLDTPGEENFFGEVIWAINVADLGILVVDSTSPVKYHLYRLYQTARDCGLPLIVFINKIDSEKSSWGQTICDLQDLLEIPHVPLVYGFNTATPLILVDLLEEASFTEENLNISYEPYPEIHQDRVKKLRENLLEVSAEAKDDFIEKYLETGTLTKEEILEGIRINLEEGRIIPIFLGSALTGRGLSLLLRRLLEIFPKRTFYTLSSTNYGLIYKTIYDPYAGKLSYGRIFSGSFKAEGSLFTSRGSEEKYTQIFTPKGDSLEATKELKEREIIIFSKIESLKTGDTFSTDLLPEAIPTPPLPEQMYTLALHPISKADEDKISSAIHKLEEEDPTIRFFRDDETRELLVSGVGKLHLERTIEKLQEKFGVKVKASLPRVPYRETIKKPVNGVIYRHKKQSGGRGQFAEVHFNVYPLDRGKGFEFEETLTGMNVPRNYVPAVEKGVREAMEKGILAGFPVVDVKVQFYDGKSHEVDSSDLAFKIASFHCFKKALEQGNPVLLEPYLELEIYVPDDTVGDVIGDLNSRRGRILGIEKSGKQTKIKAYAPMAETLEYVVTLHGITGGRGYFRSSLSHYEEVPALIAEKIISQYKNEANR